MLTLRKSEERGRAEFRLARQQAQLFLRSLPRPQTHGLRTAARDQRRPRGAGRRLPDPSPRRHGDHLLCPRRRARAQGQHRHRLGDPTGRRAAHVGRHRHPSQRVQRLEDRARALPADLDHPGAEGPGPELRAEGVRRATRSAASCASSARATGATARSPSTGTSISTPRCWRRARPSAHCCRRSRRLGAGRARNRDAERRALAPRATALRSRTAGTLRSTARTTRKCCSSTWRLSERRASRRNADPHRSTRRQHGQLSRPSHPAEQPAHHHRPAAADGVRRAVDRPPDAEEQRRCARQVRQGLQGADHHHDGRDRELLRPHLSGAARRLPGQQDPRTHLDELLGRPERARRAGRQRAQEGRRRRASGPRCAT